MNCLLVFHEIGIRGGEKVFLKISEALVNKNNKVTFVCGKLNKIHQPIPKKVKIVKSFLGIPFMFFGILGQIRKTDVIFTGESPFCLWPSIFLGTIFRKKIIFVDFEFGNKKENPISIFFAKKADIGVAINKKLLPYLKNKLSVKKSHYFPIPIDEKIFKHPKKIKRLNNKFVIFMPGVIHPAKRQDIAIKTLEIIHKKIQGAILIVGNVGKSSYKSELRKLAKSYNLDKKIIFKYIKDSELKNYYYSSDIVLMCGPIGGLTIAEASYFKKISIYPTSGSPPSGPVEELGLGVILIKNTPNEYARIILKYHKNPSNYNKKIDADKKIVDANFSSFQFSKNIIKLIK